MAIEERRGGINPINALHQAADAIVETPGMVLEASRFAQFRGGPNFDEEDLLRYFAMAKVLCDRMVPRLESIRNEFPPLGLSELYLPEGETSPVYRGTADFTPNGMIFHNSKWEILSDLYSVKMIHVMHAQLEEDFGEIKPVVERMSEHTMPNYHLNTRGVPEEAYERLSRQADNAVDVMVGLLRVIPAISPENPLAVAKNSRALPLAISALSITQFQYLLNEILEGEKRTPGYEGWDFNPNRFDIKTSNKYPDGMLVTKVPLGRMEVTYPMQILTGIDDLNPNIIVPEDAGKKRLLDIDQARTKYGCPAFELIGAMWDDLVYIVENAQLYELK